MFNVTGGRDARSLLEQMLNCRFDVVLFVTNHAGDSDKKSDITEICDTDMWKRCQTHEKIWLALEEEHQTVPARVQLFENVSAALQHLHDDRGCYDLLVTGSLHLIGAVFSVLSPDLNDAL